MLFRSVINSQTSRCYCWNTYTPRLAGRFSPKSTKPGLSFWNKRELPTEESPALQVKPVNNTALVPSNRAGYPLTTKAIGYGAGSLLDHVFGKLPGHRASPRGRTYSKRRFSSTSSDRPPCGRWITSGLPNNAAVFTRSEMARPYRMSAYNFLHFWRTCVRS